MLFSTFTPNNIKTFSIEYNNHIINWVNFFLVELIYLISKKPHCLRILQKQSLGLRCLSDRGLRRNEGIGKSPVRKWSQLKSNFIEKGTGRVGMVTTGRLRSGVSCLYFEARVRDLLTLNDHTEGRHE